MAKHMAKQIAGQAESLGTTGAVRSGKSSRNARQQLPANSDVEVSGIFGPSNSPRQSDDMKPLARLFDAAFSTRSAIEELPVATPPKQRRKLWEIPTPWHCPLIGTCLSVGELRDLAARIGFGDSSLSDYALHAMVVECCGARNDMTEALQRFLDQRHALAVRRFASAAHGDGVLSLWHESLAHGEIADSLWAAWTHAETAEYEGTVIYGDLHMLAHRKVARESSELRRERTLESGNAELRAELARLRQSHVDALRQRDQRIETLATRLADSEAERLRQRCELLHLQAARELSAENALLRQQGETLRNRISLLESRLALQTARISLIEPTAQTGPSLPTAAVIALAPDADPAVSLDHLAGHRIVCIGGRTGMVEQYRRQVASAGGEFQHHDGGQEENEHRLDALVAGADAVVCLVGHLSHSAYWRIKSACKQRGIPCLFLRSSGGTGFQRALQSLEAEWGRGKASLPAQACGIATATAAAAVCSGGRP